MSQTHSSPGDVHSGAAISDLEEARRDVVHRVGTHFTATTDILAAALELAADGWEVLPCRGKAASCARGFYAATSDAEQITRWWTDRPGANIGIRPPGGMVVLDVDPRHGGALNLHRWQDGRRLPKTLVATTGRGDHGFHAWFRAPVADPRGDLVPGVQIKSHSGYVIGPPSVHPESGGRYSWDNSLPIADAPDWLIAAMEKPIQPAVGPVTRPGSATGGGRMEGLVRYVLAAQGDRNTRLNWAAYTGRDLDHLEVAEALLRCAVEVGLPVREATATIRSGLSGAMS